MGLIRHLLATVLLLSGASVRAQHDADPRNSESWLLKFAALPAHAGAVYSGTIRATDQHGATHDSDFRLIVTGTEASGDRQVVLHRYEPACFELAPAANLILEDYCDRLTLSWRGNEAEIAFTSLDANRRYRFVLHNDGRSAGAWQSVDPGVPAPKLALQLSEGTDGLRYQWQLVALDATHAQAGTFTAAQLRESDLSGLEASLISLGEVLRSFNRDTFVHDDLPRDHPGHQPTPYTLWAEKPLDGGCLFIFCHHGEIGNTLGGSPCSPNSGNYNPRYCPWDLSIVRWPLSLRPKLRKIDDFTVAPSYWLKNVGPGDFQVLTSATDQFTFVTLAKFWTGVPIRDPLLSNNAPDCWRHESTLEFGLLVIYQPNLTILSGKTDRNWDRPMNCIDRPDGRYRLFVQIQNHDMPGYEHNNTAVSWADWVKLD